MIGISTITPTNTSINKKSLKFNFKNGNNETVCKHSGLD
jgi:hypothetical protein